MKINLSFVELHSPLFFAEKNWGQKLELAKVRSGTIRITEMIYDRADKELCLRGQSDKGFFEGFVPSSNIISYTPLPEGLGALKAPIAELVNPLVNPPKAKVKAQVGAPNDHVFAGPGAGKTNEK